MVRTVKYAWVCWLLICVGGRSFAGPADTLVYTDAQQLTLIGKPFEGGPFYHRLDTATFPAMPPAVKRLLTHSAGLAISFKTNSTKIARSEEHTSELQSLMRISYAVFCLQKNKHTRNIKLSPYQTTITTTNTIS